MNWWKGNKQILDITEVFLDNCYPGRPTWLLEDPEFVKSIFVLAGCVYDEGGFVDVLAHFISSLSKESKMLADKVSLIRIKKYRPDIFNHWLAQKGR